MRVGAMLLARVREGRLEGVVLGPWSAAGRSHPPACLPRLESKLLAAYRRADGVDSDGSGCACRANGRTKCEALSHRWCACLSASIDLRSAGAPALCTRSSRALPAHLHMRFARALCTRRRTACAHSVGGAALSSVRGVGSLAAVPRQCERGAMGPGRPTPAWTLLGRSGLAGTEFDLDSVVSELCNRVVQTLLVKQYPPGLLLNCTGSGLTPPALGAGTTSARARSH